MEKYTLKLTQDEREYLLSLISKGKSSARKLAHVRILLALDENPRESDETIARLLHVSQKTIQRVRKACVEKGIESALERKKHIRYKPHKIQGEEEARLIALCCSDPPEGRCRWTLNLLTEKLIELTVFDKVSRTTIARTLKKMN